MLHHPDLTGVAPAVIATAEFDPLRDEGVAYAAALKKAGVHVVQRHYETLIHGFFGMGLLSKASRRRRPRAVRRLQGAAGMIDA